MHVHFTQTQTVLPVDYYYDVDRQTYGRLSVLNPRIASAKGGGVKDLPAHFRYQNSGTAKDQTMLFRDFS